jgi:hypothetical protein
MPWFIIVQLSFMRELLLSLPRYLVIMLSVLVDAVNDNLPEFTDTVDDYGCHILLLYLTQR